ncbi:hypothetical protein GCM10023185_13510 [Hymenobacter saemangeumensis]|uniref:Putative zinc-finger domain-containing protein n=1 Tax=Hymenobacter saemangeumensis TaxID=1084522 RepID=A0ABP8I839_9BACT
MESNPFNCDNTRERLVDWLSPRLPATERAEMEAHLARCPACRQELAALQQLWSTLGAVDTPEPSEQLRPRFYSMLAEFQAAESRPTLWEQAKRWLQPLLQPGPGLRLAYTLLVLVAGLAIGYGVSNQRQGAGAGSPATLAAAPEAAAPDQEQRMVLAMLENPSATQRLRAVSSTKDIAQVNEQVVNALLSTLNNDPNVNVRLATLEALAELGRDPVVRQGLVHSLTLQESPLVQSALADVMVQLQVRRSVKPLRQLLQQGGLNEAVKTKIESSIKTLSNGRNADPSIPHNHETQQPRTDSRDTVAA